MTTKVAKSSIAIVAFVVLAASGSSTFAASNGQGAGGRGGSNSGSAGPGVHAPILYRTPVLVRAWKPRRRHNLPNNCQLEKWKHWDGETYYFRIRTHCRDR